MDVDRRLAASIAQKQRVIEFMNIKPIQEREIILRTSREDVLKTVRNFVDCVGCRSRLEQVFTELAKAAQELGHVQAGDLRIDANGTVAVVGDMLQNPEALAEFLDQALQEPVDEWDVRIVDAHKQIKRNVHPRCVLHSNKPVPTLTWKDAWEHLIANYWDAVLDNCVLDESVFYHALQNHLKKRKFCSACKDNVLAVYDELREAPSYVPDCHTLLPNEENAMMACEDILSPLNASHIPYTCGENIYDETPQADKFECDRVANIGCNCTENSSHTGMNPPFNPNSNGQVLVSSQPPPNQYRTPLDHTHKTQWEYNYPNKSHLGTPGSHPGNNVPASILPPKASVACGNPNPETVRLYQEVRFTRDGLCIVMPDKPNSMRALLSRAEVEGSNHMLHGVKGSGQQVRCVKTREAAQDELLTCFGIEFKARMQSLWRSKRSEEVVPSRLRRIAAGCFADILVQVINNHCGNGVLQELLEDADRPTNNLKKRHKKKDLKKKKKDSKKPKGGNTAQANVENTTYLDNEEIEYYTEKQPDFNLTPTNSTNSPTNIPNTDSTPPNSHTGEEDGRPFGTEKRNIIGKLKHLTDMLQDNFNDTDLDSEIDQSITPMQLLTSHLSVYSQDPLLSCWRSQELIAPMYSPECLTASTMASLNYSYSAKKILALPFAAQRIAFDSNCLKTGKFDVFRR